MKDDLLKHLYDIKEAAGAILRFVRQTHEGAAREDHIAGSTDPLQVAVARMLHFHWKVQPQEEDIIDAVADKDGIVCIPAVRGEQPAAERLLDILRTAYGSQWSDAILHKLLIDAGCRAGMSLDDWLRDKFFEQHSNVPVPPSEHSCWVWHRVSIALSRIAPSTRTSPPASGRGGCTGSSPPRTPSVASQPLGPSPSTSAHEVTDFLPRPPGKRGGHDFTPGRH
jgi:hypothetical protein